MSYLIEISNEELNLLEELFEKDYELVKEWQSELDHILKEKKDGDYYKDKLLTDIDVMIENGYFDNINQEQTIDRIIKLIKNL